MASDSDTEPDADGDSTSSGHFPSGVVKKLAISFKIINGRIASCYCAGLFLFLKTIWTQNRHYQDYEMMRFRCLYTKHKSIRNVLILECWPRYSFIKNSNPYSIMQFKLFFINMIGWILYLMFGCLDIYLITVWKPSKFSQRRSENGGTTVSSQRRMASSNCMPAKTVSENNNNKTKQLIFLLAWRRYFNSCWQSSWSQASP